MQDTITVRFSGEQGMGVQSVAAVACNYFARQGYWVLAVNDYASRIKGGYSFAQVKISTRPARSIDRHPEWVFAIAPGQVENDLASSGEETRVFTDAGKIKVEHPALRPVPLGDFLEPAQLRAATNVFYLGTLIGLLGLELGGLREVLAVRFGRKGEAVVTENMAIATRGWEWGRSLEDESRRLAPQEGERPQILKTGSQSLAIGAVAAGVRFHAGYPMAPSTAVMNALAGYSRSHGIVVEQAEDEIAAVNLALGASYAGVRAMTATSGGGLALMCETASMAAVSENPLVIINVQRPGPATGLPTKTAQGDLHMVLNLGHGEFGRAVLAPGDTTEACRAAQKAFYLAEKYQIPVFILSDQLLGDTLVSSGAWEVREEWQERFIKRESALEKPDLYKRYELGDSPMSPRAIPGLTNDLVLSDSHIHDEEGHITEDPELTRRMVDKLLDKLALLREEMDPPRRLFGGEAETLLVGWGSTLGVLHDACERLRDEGHRVDVLHFRDLYPLSEDAVRAAIGDARRLIGVEVNATAQLARLLRMEFGITMDDTVLKYTGRCFYADELVEELRGRLAR